MKKQILLVLLIAFSIGSKISAQTNTENNVDQTQNVSENNSTFLDFGNGVEAPADFPRFINTGNTELDQQNYSNAKAKWINDNQDLYNSLVEKSKQVNNTIHTSEDSKLDEDARKACKLVNGFYTISKKKLGKLSNLLQSYIQSKPAAFNITE